MSALAICDFTIGFPTQSGYGIAVEAVTLSKLYESSKKDLNETESIGRYTEIKNTLDELYVTFLNCFQDNWDGYNAKSISYETYLEAKNIILILDTSLSNFPMPEILPEPDGDIAFEWNDTWGQTFVFSIDDNKTINYAGLFGPNKVHGSEVLQGFIPRSIINNLSRLYR